MKVIEMRTLISEAQDKLVKRRIDSLYKLGVIIKPSKFAYTRFLIMEDIKSCSILPPAGPEYDPFGLRKPKKGKKKKS